MSIKKIPSPTSAQRPRADSSAEPSSSPPHATAAAHRPTPLDTGSPLSQSSRTTSASDVSDSSREEDLWWATLRRDTDPLCVSRSSTSSRSEGRERDDFHLSELDLSKASLPLDESWWVPLVEDTLRLAEDVVQIISPRGYRPNFTKWSKVDDWPGRTLKKLRRYRYFVAFVSAVTLINGIFSILLLQCLLGTSKVCMFGRCHSPHYTQATSAVYDRSTLNMSSPLAKQSSTSLPLSREASGQEYTEEDDEAFLNSLTQDWNVAPHPSVPRAYTLRKRHGNYRALLVQDVCYLYMQGSGPLHGRPTGVWFDADAIDAVREGDTRSFLDARELQQLDLMEILGGDGQVKGRKGASRMVTDSQKLQKRANRTVGSFVGPRGLADYLQLSSTKATRMLQDSESPRLRLVGIVGGFESHVSSFSMHAVSVSEVTSPSSSFWTTATVFFPGDRKLLSPWTGGALAAAVGPDVMVMPGQQQGQPTCFRNALFMLNERQAVAAEVDNFRQKAWSSAQSTIDFFKDAGGMLTLQIKSVPISHVQKVVNTAPNDVRLQLGFSEDLVRTSSFFLGLTRAKPRYSVTVLVDWTAGGGELGSKKIANLAAVVAMVRKAFPQLDVQFVSLAEASFVEQVAVFKRTALLIAPYGSIAGSLAFLPQGASVLEIFPYLFRSEATANAAKAAAVGYYRWENTKLANSKYEDDCYLQGHYQALSMSECRRERPCLFCVRDHSSTTVDKKEFRTVLLEAQKTVRSFLQEKSTQGRSTL